MTFPTLVLGDLDLTDWAGLQYGISVIAEGTSRGAPVPLEVAVKSWLQDGSVVVTQGYDNREVTLRVKLRGPDLLMLAEAEAALFAEVGKPNLLTWTPPDGFGPPSVFVVVTSSMEESPGPVGDLAEARSYPFRTYNLRLVCEAFVRSVDEVVTDALAASGTTTTLVDNGSATTNWTGAVNGVSTAPAVVSGAVKVTSSAVTGLVTISLTRTASIDTSVTKYLVMDWKPETPGAGTALQVYGDGIDLLYVAEAASPTAGYKRVWYYVAAASIAVLRVDASSTLATPTVRSFAVDNIDRTDAKPLIGTTRQLLQAIEVVGSARTQGSVSVEHETSALGDTIVYFFPTDPIGAYSPPLRQYRTSGSGSPLGDASLVSGFYDLLGSTSITFDVPIRDLAAGGYLLVARLQMVAPATLTWTVSTRVNATDLGVTLTGGRALPASATWDIHPLARLVLPTVDVDRDSTTAVARVVLSTSTGASTDALIDEAWLFHESGQYIQVACGTGTAASGGPARRLFITPATTDQPRPSVRIGHAADGSDSFFPAGASLAAWGFPQFTPPRVNVLTVTTNALDAAVSLRHQPSWHTHAAI